MTHESSPEQVSKAVELKRITAELDELRLFASRAAYIREVGYRDETEDGFGWVELQTREEMKDAPRRRYSLHIPFRDKNGSDRYAGVFLDQNFDNTEWYVNFTDSQEISPADLLRPLLASDSLPKGVNALITLFADASANGPYIGNFQLGSVAENQLWRDIQADLDAAGIPTQYDYDYSSSLDDDNVHVSARNLLSKADGSNYPEGTVGFRFCDVNYMNRFKFTRRIIDGEVSEYFMDDLDEVPDEMLPELTDEQRKSHPYVVIPSENVNDATMPTLPFRVIQADTTGPLTTTFTRYAETPEEAQKIADDMYRRDLAREKISYEVTAERARRVADLLHTLNNNARNTLGNA